MAKSFQPPKNKTTAGMYMCFTSGKTFTLQAMKQGENYKWSEDPRGEKVNFRRSDLPEGLPDTFILKNRKSYRVRINDDGELLDIRPAIGSFKGRFVNLAEDSDGNIFINEKEWKGNKGQHTKYQQFVANIEVVSGPFKGVLYPKYVSFTTWDKKNSECVALFGEEDGELVYGETKQLQEFFEFSGLADPDVAIRYDDDLQVLLTNISRKLSKLNNVFNFSVENGYPASITAHEDWDEDEDTDDDVDEDIEDEEVEDTPKKKRKSFDD